MNKSSNFYNDSNSQYVESLQWHERTTVPVFKKPMDDREVREFKEALAESYKVPIDDIGSKVVPISEKLAIPCRKTDEPKSKYQYKTSIDSYVMHEDAEGNIYEEKKTNYYMVIDYVVIDVNRIIFYINLERDMCDTDGNFIKREKIQRTVHTIESCVHENMQKKIADKLDKMKRPYKRAMTAQLNSHGLDTRASVDEDDDADEILVKDSNGNLLNLARNQTIQLDERGNPIIAPGQTAGSVSGPVSGPSSGPGPRSEPRPAQRPVQKPVSQRAAVPANITRPARGRQIRGKK